MKTKNKLLALLEIAIVLCSLFLVATLPAITADQNQEMQKASASEVTTASEDDYVLGIYGNANEDDTIDMRDLTYVKLIFFGKKPETELADAKYDGKINPLDFIQIKLIIVGKEKELTIVQYLGTTPNITEKAVTVKKPIGTIVVTSDSHGAIALCALGAQDRIVGVCKSALNRGELKTLLEDKTLVGLSGSRLDLEKIIELKPDIVLIYSYKSYPDYEKKLNAAGITVVKMDFWVVDKFSREARNTGWMLGNKERAEELINFEQEHFDLIKERVKDLTPEQKPRVYLESHGTDFGPGLKTLGPGSPYHDNIITCGGINIFDDLPTSYAEIDPEAVIVRNPQVIIRDVAPSKIPCGYGVTDTGPMEKLINDIMSRVGWDHIDAIKNRKIYIIDLEVLSPHTSIWCSYVAKWLHPDKFQDMDPQAIHEEWLQKFLGIEYKGVYAYPTYPVS